MLSLLIWRACGATYGLPLADVIETMRALPLERVPGGPEPLLGLSIIRGVATPVVDAGALFGHGPSRAARFISLRVDDRVVALAVDEVVGVRHLLEEATQPVPALADGAGNPCERIGILDGALLGVLRGTKLVPGELLAALPGRS